MTAAPTSTACSSLANDSSAAERYVLFFDGGSRRNPGPGGSGAVVMRVSADALSYELVWSAAVHHGDPTTTNNTAEYEGLIAGLDAASAHRWIPLEVVGDSQLVLRQLSEYRPRSTHGYTRCTNERVVSPITSTCSGGTTITGRVTEVPMPRPTSPWTPAPR